MEEENDEVVQGENEIKRYIAEASKLIEDNELLEYEKTQFLIEAILIITGSANVSRIYRIKEPTFHVSENAVHDGSSDCASCTGLMSIKFYSW